MISIIIPVYNAERTLERCVESLMKQNLNSKEFIFVNDGSKDSSLMLLKQLKEKNSNIIIVDKTNGGVSSARNAGIKAAKGKYIMFMDADDYYLDDYYISKMVKSMEINNADMAVSGLTIIKADSRNEIDIPNKIESVVDFSSNFFLYSNQGIFNSPWNKVFCKDKITALFREDMNFGEDAVFVANYLLNCKKIVLCSGCGYGYEVMDISTTAEYRKKIRYDMRQTNIYYLALAEVWFKFLDYDKALENYVKLKVQGVNTIFLRMIKKDGVILFLRSNIDIIITDSILKKNRVQILKRKPKDLLFRICRLMLNKSYIKLKLLFLYTLLLKRVRGCF